MYLALVWLACSCSLSSIAWTIALARARVLYSGRWYY